MSDNATIHTGQALKWLAHLADGSVDCIVTSPPYWRLRDYGVAGQLGLEESFEEYLRDLVAIFDDCRRVLADHGTLWLNIGDTYGDDKQLAMMPARVALALQAAGWILRADNIWSKPNPMPESADDRPTVAHEHVFLFAKSDRYFFDWHAIAEEVTGQAHDRGAGINPKAVKDAGRQGAGLRPAGRMGGGAGWRGPRVKQNEDFSAAISGVDLVAIRHPRSVWTIPTQAYPGAHFATFPEELARRCIAAGTSEAGDCSECGKPWERIVREEVSEESGSGRAGNKAQAKIGASAVDGGGNKALRQGPTTHAQTVGWRPTCACGTGYLPDDLEIISSPRGRASDGVDARKVPRGWNTGDGNHRDLTGRYDPTLKRGRKGLGRPRASDEGTTTMTRLQQRCYARQLRALKGASVWQAMVDEVGDESMAHYLRVDQTGARPVPVGVLEGWIEKAYLQYVEPPVPAGAPPSTRQPIVLDPFAGSGTTLAVAVVLGRRGLGIELNPEYVPLIERRVAAAEMERSIVAGGDGAIRAEEISDLGPLWATIPVA